MIFLPSLPLHAWRVSPRNCFLAAAAVAALVFGGISLLWLSPPLLFILALADCPMHCPCALILPSSVGHVFGLRVFSFIVAVVVRSASSSLCFASPPSLAVLPQLFVEWWPAQGLHMKRNAVFAFVCLCGVCASLFVCVCVGVRAPPRVYASASVCVCVCVGVWVCVLPDA